MKTFIKTIKRACGCTQTLTFKGSYNDNAYNAKRAEQTYCPKCQKAYDERIKNKK